MLQFIEEAAKIMLINEIELLYWYHLMVTYLEQLDDNANINYESIRLFCFLSGMFVKKFLFQYQKLKGLVGDNSPFIFSKDKLEEQIVSIEAYIKAYHYSNFDKVYRTFDREDKLLLDSQFQGNYAIIQQATEQDNYESFSYLAKLKLRDL